MYFVKEYSASTGYAVIGDMTNGESDMSLKVDKDFVSHIGAQVLGISFKGVNMERYKVTPVADMLREVYKGVRVESRVVVHERTHYVLVQLSEIDVGNPLVSKFFINQWQVGVVAINMDDIRNVNQLFWLVRQGFLPNCEYVVSGGVSYAIYK